MGVFHVISELEAEINANFASHISTIATEESKQLDTTFKLYSRERADTFIRKTLPGVGTWLDNPKAGKVDEGLRDWDVRAFIDYVYRGEDRITVAEQVELSLDAMLRVIDSITTNQSTVWGAGEGKFSISGIHDLGLLVQGSDDGPYTAGFRLIVPIRQRDTIP